jgi:hypothetical protein
MELAGCKWLMPIILAYSGGWNQEDQDSRPAWANSSGDSISKITRAKWTGLVAQVVECLLCKCYVLSSYLSPTKKIKVVQWMIIPMIFDYKEEYIILALISRDGEKHQIQW